MSVLRSVAGFCGALTAFYLLLSTCDSFFLVFHVNFVNGLGILYQCECKCRSGALSDCLPRNITAIQCKLVSPTSSMSPVVNSSPSISRMPVSNQHYQSGSAGDVSVPTFVSTCCTRSNPVFGFPSLTMSSPARSQSTNVGGIVISLFPVITTSAPLVGNDFVLGLGYSPIPNKIVPKTTSSHFVELADLLPDKKLSRNSNIPRWKTGRHSGPQTNS